MRLVDKRFGSIVEIRQGDVLSDDGSFLWPNAIGSEAGAEGAGIDSCWLNAERKENRSDVKPDYEIFSLKELLDILC